MCGGVGWIQRMCRGVGEGYQGTIGARRKKKHVVVLVVVSKGTTRKKEIRVHVVERVQVPIDKVQVRKTNQGGCRKAWCR